MTRLGVLICGVALAVTGLAAWWALRPVPLINPVATATLLARMDLDADGRVHTDELTQMLPEHTPAHLYDLDKDGWLSPSELEAVMVWVDPTWFHCGGLSRSSWDR